LGSLGIVPLPKNPVVLVGCSEMTDYQGLLQAHQFAIIDQKNLAAQDWHEGLPLLPLETRVLKIPSNRLPALLPLGPDAPYMRALLQNLELAEDDPGLLTPCALLATAPDTKPERLQRHLAECLVPYVGIGNRAYLRYFDPTVFPKLAHIIPPNHWGYLYGPAHTWTIPFQKEWIAFPEPNPEHRSRVWMLSAEQWEHIELIRYINRALEQYESYLGRPWCNFTEYDKAAQTAECAMLLAQKRYSIKEKDDLQAFAEDSLFHGEHFHRHPTIQNFLRNLPPEGYGTASAEITETIWAEVENFARNN